MPYTMLYFGRETYTIVKKNPELKDFIRDVTIATPKQRPLDMPGDVHPVGVVKSIDNKNERVLIMFRDIKNGGSYFMSEHPHTFYILKKVGDDSGLKDNNPNTAFKRSFRRI